MRWPERSQAEAREARSSSRAAEVCASCPRRPCLPGDAVTDPRGRSSGLASRPSGPRGRGGSGTRPSPVGRGREGGGWAGGGGRVRAACARSGGPASPAAPRRRGPPRAGLGRASIRPARGGVPARSRGPSGKCERWRLRHARGASYITSVRGAAAHGGEKRFGVLPLRLPSWQAGAHPPSLGQAQPQGLLHGDFQCG